MSKRARRRARSGGGLDGPAASPPVARTVPQVGAAEWRVPALKKTPAAVGAGSGRPAAGATALRSGERPSDDVPPPQVIERPDPAPKPRREPVGRTDPQEPERRRKVRRARQRIVALMLVLVAGGAGLASIGLGQVRGSTAGRYVDPRLRPEDPGFAAFVTPTPTLLVVSKAADGRLGGLAVLSLRPEDEGGSVMVLPGGTRGYFGEMSQTFTQAYAEDGVAAVSGLVEQALKSTMHETVEVDDTRWATLVEPVGSVEVRLDTPVGDWPAGDVTLRPDDVGPFLAARSEGQSELTRTDRQELFWRAWLEAVAEEGEDAIAGESDSGLGRFVRGVAAAPDVTSLPVAAVAGLADEQFSVDEAMLGAEIARSIPYPQSPAQGVRPRIRLLNGTRQPELTTRAAERLVAGGAEITISGNAASFDEPETRLVHDTPEQADIARWYQEFLGIGVVESDRSGEHASSVDESERIDLTVILGADAPEELRR